MAEFKIVMNDPKTGKSFQEDLKDESAKGLLGKKIGETLSGELIGKDGYGFILRGGSDLSGFPMRSDVPGTGRKRILATRGVGIAQGRKGMKQRKTVCGNTVHAGISQISLEIKKHGKGPLGTAESAAEEAETPPAGEKAGEGKAAEDKAAPEKKDGKPEPGK